MRTALAVRDADGNDKTYEADGSAVTMGLCMDLLQEFRADLMLGGAEDPEAAARDLTRALMSGMVGFYPYAARLFPGLTEEEYRTADPAEAVDVMRDVLAYCMELMAGIAGGQAPKNRQGSRKPSTRASSGSRSR